MRRASQTHKESSTSSRVQPRSRDDKKVTESNKQKCTSTDETMDASKISNMDDIYEFKSVKDSESPPTQKGSEVSDMELDNADPLSISTSQDDTSKRAFSEITDKNEDNANDDESRRKKRKDDGGKDGKGSAQRNVGLNKGQGGKQNAGGQPKSGAASKGGSTDRKSPCPSPKPVSTSDAEVDEGKSDLKVPPLKIVIPQSSSNEQETGSSRNGKNSSQRTHQALPYVVASSNSSDSGNDKDATGTAVNPENPGNKLDEKRDSGSSGQLEERGSSGHQRVLRSSHRSGTTQGTDRSNNSSPQLQRSHSPSPSASPAAAVQNETPSTTTAASTNVTTKTSEYQPATTSDVEVTSSATSSTSTTTTTNSVTVELHPRKRKMKPNKDSSMFSSEQQEAASEPSIHPHDQPITNCYKLYMKIRKQIDKRRSELTPVHPKAPQGFEDYLMNKCNYVLASTTPSTPKITYPPDLPPQMKDLFTEQEKERYKLKMQHTIDKEKMALTVEQEILRVHGRAARALASQILPYSVCSILKDEEVYNLITPEQEEKDRNARSRYNGRLFLSWLQDVDDKWEKIKEHMVLRHHHEAESLFAVQKMDWEWKMKEMNLCDRKSTPVIDEHHIPMVEVVDDFDLLPA